MNDIMVVVSIFLYSLCFSGIAATLQTVPSDPRLSLPSTHKTKFKGDTLHQCPQISNQHLKKRADCSLRSALLQPVFSRFKGKNLQAKVLI